jgi:hypothetical protein
MTVFNCNLPDLLNKDRSKKNINLDSESRDREDIINYIEEFGTYNLFTLKRVYPLDNKLIKTQLRFKNQSTQFNYMDEYVRDICCIIAHDLRDNLNKSIFFDLKSGYFYFYI